MGARTILYITAATGLAGVLLSGASLWPSKHAPEGLDESADTVNVPAVEASFERESYRPGDRAQLVIVDRSRILSMQVLRSGPERVATRSDTVMNGVPVAVTSDLVVWRMLENLWARLVRG